jgi:hypothetical protein
MMTKDQLRPETYRKFKTPECVASDAIAQNSEGQADDFSGRLLHIAILAGRDQPGTDRRCRAV